MTMNKIMAKLRRKENGQYRLLGLCIFLSVFLVSSFTLMFFSSSVQEGLPPGGDTRKLMWLMLGVVGIGCLLFTLYGSSLFFRNKSKTFGVMLALGADRKELAGQLFWELLTVAGTCSGAGLLLAAPASWLLWKLFQGMVPHTARTAYGLEIAGILAGILFAAVLVFHILFLGIRFIKRTNLMDILHAVRKTEMVREIRPWTGKLGIALVIFGLFLAMAVPQLTVRLFRQGMPGIWNMTYLLCVFGLYLLMLSAVFNSRKGKHPKKYYQNIISTSLMRFAARQTTRNMCVIALLVFVMILSAFWGTMYYFGATEGGSTALYDFSAHFPAREEQMGMSELSALAAEYGGNIRSYKESESLQLVIHYTGRDMNDQRQYFDVEYEKLASFVSVSELERIMGVQISLKEGEYLTVTESGYRENIWVSADCLNVIEHPVTGRTFQPVFQGTIAFDNLVMGSNPFAFVLSDVDYQRFSAGLTDEFKEEHVFFNVEEGTDLYGFADAWKRAYIARATALSSHCHLYDAHEEALALSAGELYGYSGEIDLSPDNPQLMGDWKYAPFSKVLMEAGAMELTAVFVLLSIYIAVISLSSAGVMSYVRSLTIALDNRQLFEDLRKLGADHTYIKRVIRVQLRKLFAYPVAAGCIVTGAFSLFLTYFNDMVLEAFELRMLLMEGGLMVLTAGVMYGVYKGAYRRSREIAGV